MTLVEMRDHARFHIRDAQKRFVTDAMLTGWLNDALADLNARLRLFRKEETGNDPSPITAPEDFIELLHLRIGTRDAEIVDIRAFWAASDSSASNRIVARVLGDEIQFFPATAAAWRLHYVARPALLVDNADVPEIPSQFHGRLVEYAVAKAKYLEREYETGDRFMQLYQADIIAPPFTDSGPSHPKGREHERPLITQ